MDVYYFALRIKRIHGLYESEIGNSVKSIEDVLPGDHGAVHFLCHASHAVAAHQNKMLRRLAELILFVRGPLQGWLGSANRRYRIQTVEKNTLPYKTHTSTSYTCILTLRTFTSASSSGD